MKDSLIHLRITSNSAFEKPEIEAKGLHVSKSQRIIFISESKVISSEDLDKVTNYAVFAKESKGVVIVNENGSFSVYNDPFCSIPLYYTQYKEKIIVTSEPNFLLEQGTFEPDAAGIWEAILFGSCVWSRTIHKNIFQMPSATQLTRRNGVVDLSKYWNFSVSEDLHLEKESNMIEAVDSKLLEIFSNLPNERLLMGMSGGMDCRVSAAYLKKTNQSASTQTFTYASSAVSLEYKYAADVCNYYGIEEPKLFLLNESSYRSQLDFLPKYTCGQIGIQHSHICSILKQYKSENNTPLTHLSNYYTDAVFGWDCTGKKQLTKGGDSLTLTLQKSNLVPDKIKEEILDDIEQVFASLDTESNLSSCDEFKYVSERNQKFHMNLASQQSRVMKTITPYANFELLNLMLSIPLHLRERKNVIDLLFSSGCIGNLAAGNLSSRQLVAGREFSNDGIKTKLNKYDFKLRNVISAATAKFSRGKLVYPNKYHTESHVNILHRFKPELVAVCEKLEEKGVFTKEQSDAFKAIPIKSAGVSERFQILSLNEIL